MHEQSGYCNIHGWDSHEYQDAFEEDLEPNSRKRLDIDEVS